MTGNKKTVAACLSILVCLILTGVSTVRAAVTEISPSEGTKGTAVTISGSDFGENAGRVLIGSERCRVLQWSDTLIECRIEKAMPPGKYDLVIKPNGGKDLLTIQDTFDIRGPELDMPAARPHFVSPGNVSAKTWGTERFESRTVRAISKSAGFWNGP